MKSFFLEEYFIIVLQWYIRIIIKKADLKYYVCNDEIIARLSGILDARRGHKSIRVFHPLENEIRGLPIYTSAVAWRKRGPGALMFCRRNVIVK